MTKEQGEVPFISPSWWRETETPRWVLALSTVSMALATLAGTYGVESMLWSRQQRAAEVNALIDSTREFQVYAAAFSTEMFSDKAVSTATRSKLIENLNDQFARTKTLPVKVAKVAEKELADYQSKILSMNAIVQKTDDLMSMKDFWTAASNLTASRKTLDLKLQAAI
ncbi:hypothetical protein [Mesorhizobium sp. B2-4-6]|uniref:hypothetical protein n=1 Tax=Mesorhizobium sp. B2-4-6 TaxID=2589943 RepID=UPI00112CD00C|nr:hypothetical protein [Mesorhizobium sp. B2-4-6]TPL51615.1 hypothetical protein FJ957_08545 [Mesorhizobium sp. B2-4-6]